MVDAGPLYPLAGVHRPWVVRRGRVESGDVAQPVRSAHPVARRVGFVVAAACNALLLYAINVWPGWEELSFLTAETPRVLGVVNLSLVAGLVTNVVYVAFDPPVVRTAGDLVTTAIGMVACIQVWRVFPFDFDDWWFDATLLVRALLIVAVVGSVIGIATQVTTLLYRSARGGGRGAR